MHLDSTDPFRILDRLRDQLIWLGNEHGPSAAVECVHLEIRRFLNRGQANYFSAYFMIIYGDCRPKSLTQKCALDQNRHPERCLDCPTQLIVQIIITFVSFDPVGVPNLPINRVIEGDVCCKIYINGWLALNIFGGTLEVIKQRNDIVTETKHQTLQISLD